MATDHPLQTAPGDQTEQAEQAEQANQANQAERAETAEPAKAKKRGRAAKAVGTGLRKGPDQVVGGVASGLGAFIGIDPLVVRVAFVITAFAGGAGIVLYLLGWWLLPEPDPESRAAPTRVRSLRLEPGGGLEQTIAVACIVAGLLLVLRRLGLWFNDAVVWPVACAGAGAIVLWARTADEDRKRLSAMAARIPGKPFQTLAGRVSLARVAFGAGLVLAGIGAFFASNASAVAARQVALGMLITSTGLGLLLGPWIWGLTAELRSERRERIRSDERAEMAAHLHDSVLQTLALIQRNADRPRELVALARRQERELRAWLYGEGTQRGERPATLATGVRAAADEVEALHHIDVEVVTVGDHPLDERMNALLSATREAMVNAAKHSGASVVSVYVESEPGLVRAAVRDRGKGFDPATVPDDRRGIAHSIRNRMSRHGGTADIISAPGEGTEVELELPLS